MACFEVLFELLRRVGAHGGRAHDPSGFNARFLDFRLKQQAALSIDHRPRGNSLRAGKHAVENQPALSQRFVEREFAAGIDHVEDDIGHGNFGNHLLADLLAPQPLLYLRERHRVSAFRVVAPGDDLAIEDDLAGKLAQCSNEVRK